MLDQRSIDYIAERIRQLRLDDPVYCNQCQKEFKDQFGCFASPSLEWNTETWSFWLHKCGTWRVEQKRTVNRDKPRR